MQLKKLPLSFYLRPTLKVARDLLGKQLVRKTHGKIISGKIVEVEAYLGEVDPASHAFRGKTKRNEVMFWRGGHLYVYFTYGMHFCANIVTEGEGKGRAVLLRAIEPTGGIELMLKNREIKTDEFTNLANGPAKLCQAFELKRRENGTDLLSDEIYITQYKSIPRSNIIATNRIGIKNGSDKKWRFYIRGNKYISRP